MGYPALYKVVFVILIAAFLWIMGDSEYDTSKLVVL